MILQHKKLNHFFRYMLPVCAVLLFLTVAADAKDEEWTWTLYPDLYKTMGPFERAQYDKAAGLYRQGEVDQRHNRHQDAIKAYKTAGAEWKKFRVLHGQSVDIGILAHAIFMEARSLHNSRDRYHALKSYTEVMDYFPDELWVAAPALFFRGIAYIDNGDVREGLEDMKALYDDEDYRLHPLAAGALRRLADNHWKNNQHEQAVKYWKEADRLFNETNEPEARNARDRVIDYYIREQRYSSIIDWRLEPEERNDPEKRRNIANWAWYRAYHNFHQEWSKYQGSTNRQRAKDVEAFYQWLKGQEKWYREADDMWPYYAHMIEFINRHQRAKKSESVALIDAAAQFTQTSELEDKDKDSRFLWLADRAADHGNIEKARILLGMAKDQPRAMWKEYEILGHRLGKWKEAAERLDVLRQVKDAQWQRRATWELADVYRTRLGRYEDAVKIYLEIGEPPETLWRIQDAYRRWGQTDKALGTLKEIASMFPDHAARAIYTQAEYHRNDGNEELAIGLYRQILKHPNWTKTSEASRAHQHLEEYGIATGGGVIDED